VFDLLHFDGYDLKGVPLESRKELLNEALVPLERVRILESFAEVGEIAYQVAVDHEFEGIVAKRRASRYEAGKRSRQWLKVKGTRTDEFVIGGYSEGQGSRADTFGALLVGSYDDGGRLHYAAHVGSGFDQRLLRELRARLDTLRSDRSPFADQVPLKGRTTWVRPALVAELKYAQWTPDGRLRVPVFLRLRDDKTPSEARRPAIAPVPVAPAGEQLPLSESSDLDDAVSQLREAGPKFTLTVEQHEIGLTNLDKVLWPAIDAPPITKRDFLLYLARVSPYLLPHLRDRPLTLIRLPNGITGQRFFQKHAETRPASWRRWGSSRSTPVRRTSTSSATTWPR
jgi:bifunctional non-homologous end joining protein LigD